MNKEVINNYYEICYQSQEKVLFIYCPPKMADTNH